ncbi:DUF1302 domain-containing protein [Azonexus sp.]|uniref:DUF1302 domain-containing protein n=1 Tax=Azonexus sp. TaxID=1872668 RepID=UPI0027BAC110|nr:DUF1302 domain-containing protein [Azonexus sp.]
MNYIRTAQHPGSFRLKSLTRCVLTALCAASTIGGAQAFTIDSDNADIKMSWDNTVKYSAGWRMADIDRRVADNSIGPQVNTNDGDQNFKKGAMISNRVDLLSEFDLRYKKDFGFRLSGAAWYDDVYQHSNDNPGAMGGMLSNSPSVKYNRFTKDTEKLHGRKAEFRDVFVYGNFAPADMNVNVKAGQYTQLYGETLYFGYNGIAAAQTPLDLVRALSVPNSQFKEIALPVKQLSTQVQVNQNLSFGAYYQLEWKKNRIPAAGSYFSFADFADDGGEIINLGLHPVTGTPWALTRAKDLEASDSGQGGMQMKYKLGDYEFGVYAAQYHDKMPQFYARGDVVGGNNTYSLVYAEKIRTVGISASTLIGETNVATEVSVRKNQPFVATGVTMMTGPASNNDNNPAYPKGDSLHINVSAISVLGATPLWDGASFVGEFAYNRRLKITDNAAALDPLATRSASAIQFVFQPEYFQVLPGLDVQVPIGIGYGLKGNSSVAGVAALMPIEGGGNLSVGVKGEYQKVWQLGLNYTKYFGDKGSVIKYNTAAPELSYKNFHGDRDFISLSVQRTF